MDILSTIIENGLSIRQIPKVVTSRFDYDHYMKNRGLGDTLLVGESVEFWNPDVEYFEKEYKVGRDEAETLKKNFYLRHPQGRKFMVLTEVPDNAGHWMCQQVTNTSQTVTWRKDECNLAPTLEESINLFLEKQ